MENKIEHLPEFGQYVGQDETMRFSFYRFYEVLLVVAAFVAGLILGLSMAGIR